MNIALTLVHNKSDLENQAQIDSIKSLTHAVENIHDEFNEKGEIVGQYSTFHQEFKDLDIEHEVKVYQVIPFGVTPPPNRYEINTGGIVEYGLGDEDKTGEHPRFFNWGLKRGTDNGAEISIYIEDVSSLNPKSLKATFQKLVDKNDDTEFAETSVGKIATLKLLKEKGQLDESKTISQSVNEKYKEGEVKRG